MANTQIESPTGIPCERSDSLWPVVPEAQEHYTMVFSDLPKSQLGRAKVLQCRTEVSSLCDLISEAEWLGAAEMGEVQQRDESEIRRMIIDRRISSKWGCVAALANPERDVPQDLLDGWAEHVRHH